MSAHTHKCKDCGTPVDCPGEYRPNHDGWPSAICTAYHMNYGYESWRCEACAKADEQQRAQQEQEQTK